MSIKPASGIERVLFTMTRGIALCGAAVILIAILILAVRLFVPGKSTAVSYAEVANVASSSAEPSDSTAGSESLKQLVIPKDLEPYFRGNNEQILRGWIANIPESQQKDFIKNLSRIAREAKNHKADPAAAINAYRSLKMEKLAAIETDKYTAIATKAAYLAGIFGLLIILCILSLVLVMLAVERNTRPASE